MRLIRLLACAVMAAACAAGPSAAEQESAKSAPAPAPKAAAPQATAPQATPAQKATGTTGATVNGDAALADFKMRIEKYVSDVYKPAAKGDAKPKEHTDPADIKKSQDALSARVRALRADAKPGDMFTPAVKARFRQLLYPETRGEDGRDARKVLEEDAPTNVPFKVNAKYPEGAPLPTVPASFLLNLPTLPKPLEYRIIDKHLILLDTDANIIVDYMTNVIR